MYDWDLLCRATIIGHLKIELNWMKTTSDSLVQLKSDCVRIAVSEFSNFFVTLPGLNTGI